MRLKELRKEKGVSQAQVAEELNVTQSTVSGWETGVIKKSAEDAVRLADFFDVSVDYLLGRTDTDTNNITEDAVIEFPVLDTICGGFDEPIQEVDTGKKILLPIKALRGKPASDYFVLQAKGNAMYPKILDGDKILVLRTKSVDNSSVAVILLKGDNAILKNVYFSQSGNYVDLVPTNPNYETRRIMHNDFDDVRIVGRVVKLIRDF